MLRMSTVLNEYMYMLFSRFGYNEKYTHTQYMMMSIKQSETDLRTRSPGVRMFERKSKPVINGCY